MSDEPKRALEEPEEEHFLEALELFEAGGHEAVESLFDRHPEHAERLRERLRVLADSGLLEAPGQPDAIPERLGEFVLKRRLGSGGMGVVYLAEQPSLRREVALKLIRPDQLYFPKARERFRREVEVVAGLHHRGIVPVHMTGEDQGIPYFAMERVHGVSLAQLLAELEGRTPAEIDEALIAETMARLQREADEEHEPGFARTGASWVALSFRWALELSSALEHAHHRGVLHRDVKPSNVMLTWAGEVRVLDFGLASSRQSSKITRTGSQLGSLPYMSPEQLAGDPSSVDARSDVYAVGVTLCELLTLRNPFSLPKQTELETRNRIQEGARSAIRRLNPAVPWDAETVCMAAMDPKPERRYSEVTALARDLRNVLELRPIQARRPGSALRLRRWTQRHPAWTVAAVLGSLLFIVGPSAIAVREHFVRRAMDRVQSAADLEAEIRAATLAFLTDDLLAAVRPDELGKDVSMRAALDAASERIEGRFPDQPLVEAAIRQTIGETYKQLGIHETAERHLLRAWRLHVDHAGPEARASLTGANELASLYGHMRRYEAAGELLAPTLEVRRREFGNEDPDTLASVNNLGLNRVYLGRFDEAEALLTEVYEARVRLLEADHADLLVTINNLGVLHSELGDYDASRVWTERYWKGCERSLGPAHPDTHLATKNLANTYVSLGREGDAIRLLTLSAEQSEALYGAEHPRTLRSLSALAMRHILWKRLDQAEPILARLEELLADTDPAAPIALELRFLRTNAERLAGRPGEALGLVAELSADCDQWLGPRHGLALQARGLFALLLRENGDFEGGASVMREAIELGAETSSALERAEQHLTLGSCLRQMERFDEAERELLIAFELIEGASPLHGLAVPTANMLARMYREMGDESSFEAWVARGDALRAARAGMDGPAVDE